ncbi:MAG: hypothetical protein ABH864_01805 [archaeon]
MESWLNQIFIGLMTGLVAGIVSSYLVTRLANVGLVTLAIQTIFLVLFISSISIGVYWSIFEKKNILLLFLILLESFIFSISLWVWI